MKMDREALVRTVTEEVVRQLQMSQTESPDETRSRAIGTGTDALPSCSQASRGDSDRRLEQAADSALSQAAGDKVVRDESDRALVVCTISNRHLHVSAADLETLFGKGHVLSRMKDLVQPGQFACEEVMTVATQRGRCLERVRVLGPVRARTQVEISRTDAYFLGLRPPVRSSGGLDGSPGCTLIGPAGTVVLAQGVIIANRHLHCPPETAAELGLKDGQIVCVRASHTDKPTIFGGVTVRVSTPARLELHLDMDDANGAGILNGDLLQLQTD